jgi:5-methylcytosine-specific restriction protein A
MTSTSYTHATRRSMTPLRALRVYEAAGGRCQCCGRKLGPSDGWDIDHVIALENGGTDDDTNLQLLCDWCHTSKTSDDHGQAASGKRMAARHHVPRRFKQSKWRR